MRRRSLLAVFAGLPFLAAEPFAPARAAERLGIVLMHGKEGMPDRTIVDLGAALEAAGYLVDRPEMCWSKRRIYDRAYLDCFADIDAAIARLKGRGASAIVVAGHSLGGNAALGYGARHPGLRGIIVLAGAHSPERLVHRPDIADSLARAKAIIAAGKGGETGDFADFNKGTAFSVHTTAAIYASFFGADSAAVMPENAARLTAPLLWVAGRNDATQLGPDYAFAKAPANLHNRYVTVAAGHMTTPDAAKDAVLAWLKEIAAG